PIPLRTPLHVCGRQPYSGRRWVHTTGNSSTDDCASNEGSRRKPCGVVPTPAWTGTEGSAVSIVVNVRASAIVTALAIRTRSAAINPLAVLNLKDIGADFGFGGYAGGHCHGACCRA